MWRITTVIIHLMFLGSIFVVYFRSPVIKGLQPQRDLKNPPAKRLVLIVTDGLRAQSFFKDDCKYIPAINSIFNQRGLVGISKTRVPTESRPGHIAVIAGLYEDPSAVTRGWKENPIDFDSVFNRSKKTYAWGCDEILSIFSKCSQKDKMSIFSYNDALDFSGKDKTYKLDSWVFSRVKSFIKNQRAKLKEESGTVFFLHLLGLDTAGHVHKPDTSLFYENLDVTQKGILEIYRVFEEIFDDNGTAYVLTSDHGMTNAGSHGAGDDFETTTPFVIWGAGVKDWHAIEPTEISNFERKCNVPLFHIEQASIAPLMSSLIGVAVPVNNFGVLPAETLNVTQEYLAKAVQNNALQMIEQYQQLLFNFKKGFFSKNMPQFEHLTLLDIDEFYFHIDKYMHQKNYKGVISLSHRILIDSQLGIEYYQTYYQTVLQYCVGLAFVGWMAYICGLINDVKTERNIMVTGAVMLGLMFIGVIAYMQNIPIEVAILMMLPLVCWFDVFSMNLPSTLHFTLENTTGLICCILGACLMMLSFFHRELMCITFLASSLFQARSFPKRLRSLQRSKWLPSLIFVSLFPLLPSVNGFKSNSLVLIGAMIWFIKGAVDRLYADKICLMFSITSVVNVTGCLYFHYNLLGVPTALLATSWCLAVVSFIAPMTSEIVLRRRILYVFHYLQATYMLLSVSYEFIFILLLCYHLLMTIDNQRCAVYAGKLLTEKLRTSEYLKLAFNVLLYTMLSFFGTGNFASISSFDPNISRCFVTTFLPFVIMSLVILKLAIPIIFIVGVICEYGAPEYNRSKIFMCILLICEFMGVNFFFLVKNTGSWLEIGTSISHFVIMEVTTVVLLIIHYISKFLVKFDLLKLQNLSFESYAADQMFRSKNS